MQQRRGIRLHHRRRRLGRLRARQPAERRRQIAGAAAGSRRQATRNLMIHVPVGYSQTLKDPKVNWLFRPSRTRATAAACLVAARQGAGRLVLDQRPALHPRPARRLSTAGASSAARLGVGRRAPLFPARRAPGAPAPTSITPPAGRSTSPTSPRPTSSTTRSSRPASRPAFRRNPDVNGAEQEGVGHYS